MFAGYGVEFLAGVGAGARADEVAEFEDHRVRNGVEGVIALAAAVEEPGVEERGEMAGNVGLIALKGFDYL